MTTDVFFPPGVQAQIMRAGMTVPTSAPDAIAERIAELWVERNECPEDALDRVDATMLRWGMVLARIGTRTEITRAEMAAILSDCYPDTLAEVSTIASRSAAGQLYVGDRWMADIVTSTDDSLPPSLRSRRPTAAEETEAVAAAWAAMCRGITCVSVTDDHVRHDAPGSMHPNQHATITFMPADLASHETDPVSYMSRHCDLLLLVTDEQIETAQV